MISIQHLKPMTEALLSVETFIRNKPIWECACGDGAMAKVLERNGYKVFGTDTKPRGYGYKRDFLWFGECFWPSIVTNPPFNLSNAFIEKATSYQPKKIAFLVNSPRLKQKNDPIFWNEQC